MNGPLSGRTQKSPLATPTFLSSEATNEIAEALIALLPDSFVLYLNTKNFHWHVSGPHFHDYHRMFDKQAAEIFAMTDPLAERACKIGGTTLRSISRIAYQQRPLDNDAGYVERATGRQQAFGRLHGAMTMWMSQTGFSVIFSTCWRIISPLGQSRMRLRPQTHQRLRRSTLQSL
jgi:hypothetical protein